MVDEIKGKLLKEIEEARTINVLEYDDNAKDKWKPMRCQLCGRYFARRGIDRHLRFAHGIERFDYGIRDAKLEQHKETKLDTIKKVLQIINKYPISGNVNVDGKLSSIESVMKNEIIEEFTINTKGEQK